MTGLRNVDSKVTARLFRLKDWPPATARATVDEDFIQGRRGIDHHAVTVEGQ